MKLFISYSPDDANSAVSLVPHLNNSGHDAWYDHKIEEGQRWETVLKEQITSCDAFIYVVSKSALKSEWSKREFRTAKKARLPLLVVVTDKELLADLPSDLKKLDVTDATGGYTEHNLVSLMQHLREIDQQLTAERERRSAREAAAPAPRPVEHGPEMVLPLATQKVESAGNPELAAQANDLIASGAWDEALNMLDKLAAQEAENATVYSARGCVYGYIGETEKALKDCTKAITLDAKLAVAHNNLGMLYNFRDKSKEALACFTLALELDPTLAGAYVSRGLLNYEADKVNEALQDFEKAAELKPDDYAAQNNRAFVLYQLGKVAEAEAAWQIATGLPDAEAHVFANHAVALEQLGRKDEAVAQYHKAVEMDRKWKNQLEKMADDYRWNHDMVVQARSILKRLRR
ncbi:MAG: TIR domain-containing protein [Anaerolineae bacterium]